VDKKFYTFLTADVCWAVWIIHNKITFEGYKMNNLVVISFTTCAFLKCWAGLYVVEDAAWISIGAQKVIKVAQLTSSLQPTTVPTATPILVIKESYLQLVFVLVCMSFVHCLFPRTVFW
jgi:hypothetical protein